MKIMINSDFKNINEKTGWFRGGKEIFYFENHILKE